MTFRLKEFKESLSARLKDANGTRPFVCEGNPLACPVALVGINPAQQSEFWNFWDDDKGMDRHRWITAYRQTRKLSRSRSAIERFVPQVLASVIELNAYVRQSGRFAELDRKSRASGILTFLLDAVRPKVVARAGVTATTVIRNMEFSWNPVILETKHFIYWGRESETELANRINSYL